ncbi:NADH dehydrogenase [ubiquinone] 1 beta subcomplex subunit 5, mitochondrial-like [Amphiura filiformis]|uniref:NADH dehydrogenase [ubiquinone] 1 beta subcomplex subunit 5, mitochondrial-like n=1 Tax=Amphiura filiformis TaxID=82378 RepID=UPI003B211B8B
MATLCGKICPGLMSFYRINSPLCRALHQVKCTPVAKDGYMTIMRRGMAGGKAPKFFIKPPEYAERAMLRKFVKYLAYTGVPLMGLVTFINVFIGPAQLREIPEGYEPKHWEYYQHPIQRFFARYVSKSPQQEYEKAAQFMEETYLKKEARLELMAVRKLMKERGDGYYTFVRGVPKQDFKEDN